MKAQSIIPTSAYLVDGWGILKLISEEEVECDI